MMKFVGGFIGAAALSCVTLFMTPATPAFAQKSASCERCAPKATTSYRYKTVQRVTNSTRYKDVTRNHVVPRVHRIVTVTRVQPIHRVNVVTRVHNRTVFRNVTQHVSQTRMMPARTVTSAKTVQLGGGCRC
jgi:hypothetical protein